MADKKKAGEVPKDFLRIIDPKSPWFKSNAEIAEKSLVKKSPNLLSSIDIMENKFTQSFGFGHQKQKVPDGLVSKSSTNLDTSATKLNRPQRGQETISEAISESDREKFLAGLENASKNNRNEFLEGFPILRDINGEPVELLSSSSFSSIAKDIK